MRTKSQIMRSFFLGLVLMFGVTTGARASIVLGQVDDFEDGTIMSWFGGATQVNVADGGPLGLGDNYMSVTSNGLNGPGSRLATYNEVQWSGDYTAAGVTGITVDLKNFGTEDLSMRLFLLNGDGGNFTTNVAVSLPADGQWHTLYFGMTAADLITVDGGWDLDLTLSNLPRLMIRHQPGEPAGIGAPPPIATTVGFDNITAVPEPGTLALLAIGLATLRRRR
ncbi:MAG: hypothetical protein DCC65_14925 [Planctomycetota bacterium]|nr:MAG: hypothetical protein DCC65_14925 [Planctomycetota bacterium]